jgi:hypothetical protein
MVSLMDLIQQATSKASALFGGGSVAATVAQATQQATAPVNNAPVVSPVNVVDTVTQAAADATAKPKAKMVKKYFCVEGLLAQTVVNTLVSTRFVVDMPKGILLCPTVARLELFPNVSGVAFGNAQQWAYVLLGDKVAEIAALGMPFQATGIIGGKHTSTISGDVAAHVVCNSDHSMQAFPTQRQVGYDADGKLSLTASMISMSCAGVGGFKFSVEGYVLCGE